jgi:hypothetical protein
VDEHDRSKTRGTKATGRIPGPTRERGGQRLPWPVLTAAGFVFIFCAAYNYFVFEHVPHVHDEIAYLFQARIFLTGHFSAPLPCAPGSFDFPHIVNSGRWYSIYPPGFPALLALGLLLGVPWLINPLLGGLAVILIFLLGVEVYSRRVGILAALLSAVSLWMLLTSSSLMSHTSSMFAGAVFLLFSFRSLRAPTIVNGLAAGLGLGAAILIRPANAVLLAAVFLVVLVIWTVREFKARWKNILALALAMGLAAGFFLYYNAATTGHALKPGYIARYGSAYSVVFGRPATLDFDFTPLTSVVQIGDNLGAINRYLFGWPLTSLWPLLFLVWAWIRREEGTGRDLLLLSAFLTMLVGFFFFWGAFTYFGARMYFEAFPLLVLLAARGLDAAPKLLAGAARGVGVKAWTRVLAGCLVVLVVYAFAVSWPGWVAPAKAEWYYDRYDHNLAGSSARVGNAVAAAGIHNALVVIKLLYAPVMGFPSGWWGSGFMHDTPGLDSDVIYANDRGGAANLELARCFSGRRLFVYWGTLDKGVLVPLETEGGAGTLRPGEPVQAAKPGKREVELLAKPELMFKVYSSEFGAFLEEVMQTEPGGWLDLDSPRLMRIGLASVARSDFRRASFAFEAALQVEKYPRQRSELLGQLTQCYAKTGQRAEAKRLMQRMADVGFYQDQLYSVFPERGF